MKRIILLTVVLACPEAKAQGLKWWRSLTPNQNQAVACQLAQDDQSLTKVLQSLGWDKNTFPNVDWARLNVVIIAPSLYHQGYHLAFIEEHKLDGVVDFR